MSELTTLLTGVLLGLALGLPSGFCLGWIGARVHFGLVKAKELTPSMFTRLAGVARVLAQALVHDLAAVLGVRDRRDRTRSSAPEEQPELAVARKGTGTGDD